MVEFARLTAHEQVDYLQAQNAILQGKLASIRRCLLEPPLDAPEWGLDHLQAALFAILARAALHGNWVSKEAICHLIYGPRSTQVDPNTIESHVSKLNKKVQPFGVRIESRRQQGYRLDEVTRAGIRHRLETEGITWPAV